MDDNDLDSFNVSFIDIVKNFLGLLILILVLLQGSVAVTEAFRAPLRPGKDEPVRPFNAPLRDYLHPLTDHYLVAANLIAPIDLGKLAALIESGALEGKEKKAEVALLGNDLLGAGAVSAPTIVEALVPIPGPWWRERDLNNFRFGLTFPSFDPASELPPKEALKDLVGAIVAKSQSGTRGMQFHVSATGFALFSAVHQELTRRQVCFRWYAFKTGETVELERSPEHFSFYKSRKCRVQRS
jgi:hypothetical protein